MMKSQTPRTDKMTKELRGWDEYARARNFAYLCRKLEVELRELGKCLSYQNERWGLYGNESQAALRKFNKNNK